MFNEYVGARVQKIRSGIEGADIRKGLLSQVSFFLNAIEEGRFCFRLEQWHQVALHHGEACEIEIAEMLLHVVGRDHEPQKVFEALQGIYEAGYHKELDSLITALAVQQAEALDQFPVSINIAAQSAGSETFWRELRPVLCGFKPEQFVFELLEHDYEPSEAEIKVMRAMQKMGYRFALDDVGNNDRDIARVKNFGGMVDYIKLCGRMVEQWELGEAGLIGFVDHIRMTAGHAVLVAEWVSSVAHARYLAEIGISAVQGRMLPSDREAFVCLYRQTPVLMIQSNGHLSQAFALSQVAA